MNLVCNLRILRNIIGYGLMMEQNQELLSGFNFRQVQYGKLNVVLDREAFACLIDSKRIPHSPLFQKKMVEEHVF